ncbi:MAG: hypothetical protein WBL46_03500, partial [Nitrososphaeraceae archaeon]
IDPRPIISQSLSNVILSRGSTRKFSRQPIAFEQFSNILYSLTKRIDSDFFDKKSMIDIYFIANEVANLQSGAYFFNRKDNSINLLNSKIMMIQGIHYRFLSRSSSLYVRRRSM